MIHSLLEGHIDCFYFLFIVNRTAINMATKVSVGYVKGHRLTVVQLSHKADAFLVSWNSQHWIPKWLTQLGILPCVFICFADLCHSDKDKIKCKSSFALHFPNCYGNEYFLGDSNSTFFFSFSELWSDPGPIF